MHGLIRNIHAIVLTLAVVVALAAIAATNATAQVTQLLFEDRAADAKEGTLF
jgi:FlaG/FlaF family flagellin (archaellin)